MTIYKGFLSPTAMLTFFNGVLTKITILNMKTGRCCSLSLSLLFAWFFYSLINRVLSHLLQFLGAVPSDSFINPQLVHLYLVKLCFLLLCCISLVI